MRSPPPASRLVACIQARVPGASVMTEPATRPNQSKPLTAPATSRAVASPQPPPTSTAQAVTTPHCTITIGTPSSSAWTRCSRTAASTRPPSTSRRCACTLGVEAASFTVRTESSAETSERPNRARAAADAAADRPATRRPSDEASAEATMTASRTPPASRLWAATAVTATIASPLMKSTQRSAYRASRSASMARATTSPGGVRARRCWAVWPESTEVRTRSITETHQRG